MSRVPALQHTGAEYGCTCICFVVASKSPHGATLSVLALLVSRNARTFRDGQRSSCVHSGGAVALPLCSSSSNNNSDTIDRQNTGYTGVSTRYLRAYGWCCFWRTPVTTSAELHFWMYWKFCFDSSSPATTYVRLDTLFSGTECRRSTRNNSQQLGASTWVAETLECISYNMVCCSDPIILVGTSKQENRRVYFPISSTRVSCCLAPSFLAAPLCVCVSSH